MRCLLLFNHWKRKTQSMQTPKYTFPLIKICGLTQLEQMEQIDDLGVDYLGFIYWNASPRAYKLPNIPLKTKAKKVGVFVNETIDVVEKTVESMGLDVIQLHGNESAAYCDMLTAKGYRVWKALPPEFCTADQTKKYAEVVEYILWEHRHQKVGGSGQVFDWRILETQPSVDFVLSGGLGVENLSEIQKFLKSLTAEKCRVLDFNSCLEDKPGIKNMNKINELKQRIGYEHDYSYTR